MPTTHHFQPTHYHTTLGSHEPVLHIADGDTIVTTTVDSRGHDASNEPATPPGNPQTGPFYVDGATPGDTLVMHLDRIEPNRESGYSYSIIAPNVLDPEFVRTLPEGQVVEWRIDRERGMAHLHSPVWGIREISLPLAPMLGCFGVAPPRGQAISTATSGHHGGNMDYRRFAPGATVYFPVFVPGALLYVGDGHAVQGDGEIVGTGIEVSCDVQFTVHVRKARAIAWPRGEDDECIFCVGNARPLDQAVQHATTEMVRYLTEESEMDIRTASTLLGMCVEYDLGNVFDPAYTMVCKLPKQRLRELGLPDSMAR